MRQYLRPLLKALCVTVVAHGEPVSFPSEYFDWFCTEAPDRDCGRIYLVNVGAQIAIFTQGQEAQAVAWVRGLFQALADAA